MAVLGFIFELFFCIYSTEWTEILLLQKGTHSINIRELFL